ncbi:MAG: metallophosphoesterase family protein [Spirochaetes bacterium]|nr:metallophosphoesterase family protein [Spirochaetota bacterium]
MNFSFIYQNTLFCFLDSSSGGLEKELYGVIDSWLSPSAALKIVITHYPLIDPSGVQGGSFSSRNEVYKLLGMLVRGGTDLLFFGDIHSYYHYSLAGVDSYISGGGGAMPRKYDNIGRHYLKISVNSATGSYSVERKDVD